MFLKTLYINGMIFTSNEEIPYAEAMSVTLGGIDYVGSTQELLENFGITGLSDPKLSEFEVIDLKGRTVIPGFIDADIRERAFNGTELASKGIIGVCADASIGNEDMFNSYLDASNQGLNQYVSLYYPWKFIKENPHVLDDKQRMIRSRNVHVAGITIEGEMETTEEEFMEALEFCKENYCQMSVKITDEDPSVTMLQLLMQEDNWFEDLELPPGRVHRGESDFDPFVSIKRDLIEEINAQEEREDDAFYGLDSIVIGYTRLAATYSGMLDVGEIKRGGRACFLILDRDLSRIPVDELDQVHPEVTIIDGRIAYKAEGSTFQLKDKRAESSSDLSSGLKLVDR